MGGAIARHLMAAGRDVRILTRSASRARSVVARWPGGPQALQENRVTFAEGDVTDARSLPAAVEGASVVIQATQFPGAPVEDPRKGYTYLNVDRGGTINLVAAATSSRPHIMYLSGVGVTEGHGFPWVRAKLEAEEAVQTGGCPWTIVRSSWAYGPGDRSLNRLLGYARRLPFLPFFGDGQELVTPVHVEDVGRLFAELAAAPEAAADAVLPLGGPETLTMNDVLRTGMDVMQTRRPILHVPLPLGRAMGAVAQYLPGRPLTPGAVDFVAHGGVADPAPIAALLPAFETVPLRTALSAYLAPKMGGRT